MVPSCDEAEDVDDADVVLVAVAAAIASLSMLSASLMCSGERPGILRKWASPDALRQGGVEDHVAEYGDPSRELFREGMESGCK